jgi:hypothetical protein
MDKPTLPINSSAAGGQAQGGFAPTSGIDLQMAEARRLGSLNLMEYADTHNPRTRALSRLGARGLSGAHTSEQLESWLNYTRAGFFAQQGARALQNTLGSGSFTDLAFGAQQTMGGAGLMLNRQRGGPQTISGGGMVTDALAKRVFDRMSNYYYDDRGLADKSRTLGRDTTEISRAMQLTAASGQLAGTSAFTFGKLTTAERLRNVYSDLKASGHSGEARTVMDTINQIRGQGMNEQQATKLAESVQSRAQAGGKDALAKAIKSSVLATDMGFKEEPEFMKKMQGGMKSLMKLHDTMKDIFGDIKDFEAMNMGSQITGVSLNSINAFTKIRSGMEKIKNDAAAVGVGASPYAQSVGAFGQMYGAAFGSAGFGSMYATQYTAAAYKAARESQQTYNETGRGRAHSAEEINAENAKDAGMLSKEPGAVAALQLAYQLKNNPLVADNKELSGRIRGALDTLGSARVGSEKSAATEGIFRLIEETGGVDKSTAEILDDLKDAPEGAMARNMLHDATQRSIEHNYKREAEGIGNSGKNRLGAGFANNAGDVLYGLDTALGKKNSSEIAKLLYEGKKGQAYAMINNPDNAAYFESAGIDPSKLIQQIEAGAGDTKGGMKAFGGGLQYLASTNDIQSKNNESFKNKVDTENDVAGKMAMDAITGDVRSKKDSLGRAAADIIFSGGTAADVDTRDVMTYADTSGIVGANGKFLYDGERKSLNFTEAQLDSWSNNSAFMKSMGVGSREELATSLGKQGSYSKVATAFSELGYTAQGTSIGGKQGIMFASQDQMELSTTNLKGAAYDKYLKTLGVDVDDPELLNALKTGQTDDIDPSKLNKFRDKEKAALGKPFQSVGYAHYDAIRRAQVVKDSIYGGDATSAATTLAALQTPGVIDDEGRAALFKNLQQDDKLMEKAKNMGIDVSNWKSDESGDTVQQTLAKVAGVDYKSKAGGGAAAGQTMPSMTVQHMTVLKQS